METILIHIESRNQTVIVKDRDKKPLCQVTTERFRNILDPEQLHGFVHDRQTQFAVPRETFKQL